MIHVVTHNAPRSPSHNEFFALSSEWNARVCIEQGMSFSSDTKRRVPSENFWREKAAKLIEYMSGIANGEQVLWIDGDCLMVGENIAEIFKDLKGRELGMVKFGKSRLWSCGVCPMVKHDAVVGLWKSVLESKNPTLLDLEEHARALDKCDVMYGVTVQELPRVWNEAREDVGADTKIIGFHGLDGFAKKCFIEAEIRRRKQ